jgi:hypothetical protein
MTASSPQQESSDVPPAPPPEARQFDFWIGEWDVVWQGGSGTNVIRSTLGGHVIEEQFRSEAPPLHGMSVSVYNPQLRKWQQTWVDNHGSYLDLIGEYQDGAMSLGMKRIVNGQPVRMRMLFYNIATDQLDWNWERSDDDGRTWQLLWQIHYTRKQPA